MKNCIKYFDVEKLVKMFAPLLIEYMHNSTSDVKDRASETLCCIIRNTNNASSRRDLLNKIKKEFGNSTNFSGMCITSMKYYIPILLYTMCVCVCTHCILYIYV